MQISKCRHASILVSNIQQAEFFYSSILGLAQAPHRPLKFPGIWYQLGDFQIHLIEDREFTHKNFVNPEKWGRNPHLALVVDNLAMAEEKLQSNGYAIQKSFSGRTALFTKDPDGNILELIQNE